ncbi:TrmB family transcriptional regulator [Halosimplex pelagicum]|uniref:TrmB family transcriptional regulator n=1 Tax=Halosimplex pelagicum TaxID=869886 RepID=A0A7D5P610_9EURY|nr:helix-turn-helix domain-containing protein [Halosimplex pelagicum]QLH81666.1 TrmB family transcriptional regulator [Halosimplex pelagicum]
MSEELPESARSVAVEQLAELGLSTYAARTYVALASLGDGTAQDVSEVADVPRTRVYDAVGELEDHGLVDVRQSTPKRFWPVSAETTGRHFERQYRDRVDRLTDALGNLEHADRVDEQRGVWTVTGRATVTDRIVEFVDDADDEIVFMTVEDLLTDEIVASLAAASDRGVSIRVAGLSDDVGDVLSEHVPDVETFDSIWVWSDTPTGRLVMVDGRKTLVSVLVREGEASDPPSRDETAIWGSGETNSLVVILRAMFTWQLDGDRA